MQTTDPIDREIVAIKARVERLERTLAAVRDAADRAGSRAPRDRLIGGVLTIVAVMVAFRVGASAGPSVQGPATFKSPLTVVGENGQTVAQIEDAGNGGRVSVYSSGRRVAEIASSQSGCCGKVEVYELGQDKPKAALAVDTTDRGSLWLFGSEGEGYLKALAAGLVLTNDNGNALVSLRKLDDGTGSVRTWSAAGSLAAEIDGGADAGKITLSGKGTARTTIGVSADDAGLIVLNSIKGSTLTVHGNGVFRANNPAGKEVVDFGIDPSGNGILDVRGSAGVGGVRLDVGQNGAGNVKIHSPPFEIMAQLGAKEGEKGDVCVMGRQGLVCLSGVAIKSLIPW